MMLENIKNKFIVLLAASVLCMAVSFCFSAPAFAEKKVRIAVVVSSSIKPYKEALEGYYDELRQRGLVFRPMEFFMDESSDYTGLISRINAFRPALVHSVGTDATRLAKENIKDVPVVFSMVLNPVAGGLIKSMSASANNLTGASMDLPFSLQFSYMRELKPGLKKIGVIYSEKETGAVVREAKRSARLMGLELISEAVEGPQGVPGAIKRLKGRVDFMWSVADGNVFTRETVRELLLVSLRKKIPLMGLSPAFVKAGALFAVSIHPDMVGRQAAGLTMDVLGGKKPSGIPVAVPTDGDLLVNRNTLKILGLEPSPSIFEKARMIDP